MSTPKAVVRDGGVVAASWVAPILARGARSRQVAVLHDVQDAVRLRRCLQWLMERYSIVSVAALLASPGVAEEPRLVLTFDDGYASWHDVVAPVLVDLGCPATFFVCSGFVGLGTEDARRFRAERLRRSRDLAPLSVSQLAALAATPTFTIGSHTRSHVDLGDPSNRASVDREVDGDRRQLEDWTGRPVRWFAYPFGGPNQLSTWAVEHVRNAEFLGAFTTLPGTVGSGTDRFLLPRQSIDVLGRPALWKGRLNGGYDLVFAAKQRLGSRRFVPNER